MKKLSWIDFKSICKNNLLTMLMEEKDSYYLITAANGPVFYRCDLVKENPASVDQLDFETNFKNNCNKKIIRNDAFAEKTLSTGKRLFRRAHGIQHTLVANSDNVIEFTTPYVWCKITTMEIINLPEVMQVDLTVHADINGNFKTSIDGPTIPTGQSKYKLNQFGFNVNASKDFYKDHSEYDADLFQNMIIRVVIKNNTNLTTTVGINFTLHEVV